MFALLVGLTVCIILGKLFPEVSSDGNESEILIGSEGRIVWGVNAQPGEFPFMASVQSEENSGSGRWIHICGGTLVGERKVITAAHCFLKPYTKLSVVLGAHHIRNTFEVGRQRIVVKEVINHPKFSGPPALSFDIAILDLSTDVNLTTGNVNYESIRFSSSDNYPVGKTCTVMGWGRLQTNGAKPNSLQKTAVSIITLKDCGLKKATYKIDEHICAANPPRGFCSGDSGGPLVCPAPGAANKFIFKGLVSKSADPCGAPGKPGIYIRLGYPPVLNFIKEHVQTLSPNSSPSKQQQQHEFFTSILILLFQLCVM